MVKNFIFYLFIINSLLANHRAYLKEKIILNNEVGELIIITNKKIKKIAYPQIFGINWLRTQQQRYKSKNNQYTAIFSIDDLGTIEIPSIKIIYEDNSEEMTKKFNLKVILGRNLSNNLEEHLFMKMFINGAENNGSKKNLKDVYVGVPLEVELRIYISNNLTSQNFEDIIFDNNLEGLSSEEKMRYEGKAIENNYRYKTIHYKEELIPFRLGEVFGDFITTIGISQRRISIFKNYQKKKLKLSLPKINILPLPKLKSNTFSLNLIGNWQVKTSINKSKVKIGELFEYKFIIEGDGDIDRLNNDFKSLFNGFQIYNQEKVKIDLGQGRNKLMITIPLIAKSQQSKIKSLFLATFNSDRLKYDYFPIETNLIIEKEIGSIKTNLIIKKEIGLIDTLKQEKIYEDKIKLEKGKFRSFSITKEFIGYILTSSIFLYLAFLVIFKFKYSKKKLEKKKLRQNKKKLLKKLKQLKEEDLLLFIRQDLVNFLVDYYRLDSGVCAEEIISICPDDLQDVLKIAINFFTKGKISLKYDKINKAIQNLKI